MKKIGIIGGAGPLASALLYQYLVQECYCNCICVPELILHNYPFTRGLSPEEGNRSRHIIMDELQRSIHLLNNAGASIGLLACNTLHHYLAQVDFLGIDFLEIPKLILKKAAHNGHKALLFLGTENSCRIGLYESSSVKTVYPSVSEQQLLNSIIDRILEGKIQQQDSAKVSSIILTISGRMDFDGIVLGCTDLPVLHSRFPIQSDFPLFDSIRIPAQTLIGLL